MSCRLRVALAACCLAGILAGAARAHAAPAPNLNPFRGTAGGNDARPAGTPSIWDPVRRQVSDATAASTTTPSATSATPSPLPSPSSSLPPASSNAAAPAACTDDSECPDNTYCETARCQRIERSVNVLYLYYQEGAFREILGLYWSRRGSTGYTVVAPIYWSFFSPTSRTRIVAPFYWRFEDDAARRTSTVIVPILPISWSRQPDARSFGVWPLFYRSTKFGWAAPLLGSFKAADPDRGRSFGALAYLYWWKRAPDGAFDLGFPLFVSSRSAASAFTFALPLNFYWRTGDDAHTLGIPLFYAHTWKNGASFYSWVGYQRREGRDTSGSLLWLYWFGRDDEHARGHDVVFPLLWSFRSRHTGTTVFFPLLWDFRDHDSRTTIAGLVGHFRDGGGWLNTVFPLWWSGGSTDSGWRFQLLVPFFYWHKTGHGTSLTWITPIGGYNHDAEEKSRTLFLLPAPIFVRRDPTRDITVATPFYIRHHHHATDATTRLIAALLYLSDDPHGSTSVVFPLFWRFHDEPTGATATALLPFFFHRAGPTDHTTMAGIFPLWFYRRQFADGGWGEGLFPIAFFGEHRDRSHAVVFPLFWHFKGPQDSTTLLFPLFVAHHDRDGHSAAILPLLAFYGGSRDGTSYQVQFPLFWRFADARTHAAMAVTPLGFFGRSPDGWSAGFGPLLPIVWAAGGGPQRHVVVFPLFWHFADDRADASTTVVANVLHRRRGGETTDAFFPLVYYRRGARAPGDDGGTTLTVLPFFHYHRDAFTRVLLTPIGASAEGPRRQAGFVGPYFWYRGPAYTARGIPFLYADVTRRDTGERTRQIGPFIAIDAPDNRARVLLPFFGHYENPHERGTYVFPSFFHLRTTDGGAVDTFLPLFWHSTGPGRVTTVVGPWYRHQEPGVYDTGLAPLYFWAKNSDRTLLCLPALLTFHRRDFRNDSSWTIAGLFFRRRAGLNESVVVFPLFWAARDKDHAHRVLAPFYWHFEDTPRASAWTALTLLYWSHRGSERTRAFLPVAWYTRDDVKHTGSEALLPIFYVSHGPAQISVFTLLGGYGRSPTGRFWYAGPLGASDSNERSLRMLAPLYFSSLHRSTETRTRFFLPLLHFFRGTPEKSFTTWAALFWRRADVASATTLVLPLFIDVHDYLQSRTTVLLPLFVRHSDEITGDSTVIAPLFYRHGSPTESTTVLFPIVWDFRSHDRDHDRRTTVVFPLFAHWTRPTVTGTYVFPNIYYRKGFTHTAEERSPDGTWRLFIPPLFDAAVGRPGDFRWEILGGLFGKENIGRNTYLKVFFFTIQTQKASAVQTAWYGQPRRTPRAHPIRGLATSNW